MATTRKRSFPSSARASLVPFRQKRLGHYDKKKWREIDDFGWIRSNELETKTWVAQISIVSMSNLA
ncbi:MAG: hypothetical protein D6728_05990 [Cyanobacteria bacterium J055]|nr:MAG: hypothetical protein D6728_05990 [Cyanobacteria bacterium J055]